MTIMVRSYIDKALRAEHRLKHKQRKSLSINRTHAICLNPTGILTGKRPSSHVRLQRTLLRSPVLPCLANLNNQWQANEYFECTCPTGFSIKISIEKTNLK